MSSTKSLKILVCGDVDGRLDALYKRVNSIIAKGQQFDSLFVVGEFFSPFSEALTVWKEFLSGVKKAPIVTYVLAPKSENLSKFYEGCEEGGELCPNIIFMGKRGVVTNAGGMRVAYFSGKDCGAVKTSGCTYSQEDVVKFLRPLVSSETQVDLLLTSDWPSGVTKYAGSNVTASQVSGSTGIAQMAFFLKPRYHFTAARGDFFYERVPYRNHVILTERPIQASRFISMAQVGGKEKWLYAFTITPMAHVAHKELTKQADNTTENPYPRFVLADEEEKAYQGFFYDQTANFDEPRNKRQKKEHPPRVQQISQDDCWFCLASPKVAKHLICAIGDLCYIALAKGAIVPLHCMILPVAHQRNVSELDAETKIELAKHKNALNRFYASKGLYAVYFERNYKCSHMQLQVVPISNKIAEDDVKKAFFDYGASVGVSLEEIPLKTEVVQAVGKGSPYFLAEFARTKLLSRIKGNFPLNFGREVVACSDILGMEDRSDWKECSVSRKEEAEMTERFKEAYGPFDFTVEDDDD